MTKPNAMQLFAATRVSIFALAAVIALPQDGRAQAARPDTTGPLPLAPTRNLKFTTDEGTWLDLDVSPDGKTIVFELVGDLYTIPIQGGKATRITSGMAYDAQPRYSPDGKRIVFVSDRSGSENLWLIDADGNNPKAVTQGGGIRYQSPEWSPDGYLVASKGTGGGAYDQRSYDLVMYDLRGGSGISIGLGGGGGGFGGGVLFGAAFGNDPRYLYYASGGPFGNGTVQRLDRADGTIKQIASSRGGAVRPVVSPDGKWLAYGRRYDDGQAFVLVNLTTGEERILTKEIQRDERESIPSRDMMPGASFTPDGQAIIAYNRGHIWRISVTDGQATLIPFSAEVDVPMGPLVRFEYTIDDTSLVAQQIRDPRTSPDGKQLAFVALGKVWILDLAGCRAAPQSAGCAPRRLTTAPAEESERDPVWSPDGKFLAFTTWTEGPTGGGAIARTSISGAPVAAERLTTDRDHYADLAYTPDGKRIVAGRASRLSALKGFAGSGDLVWIPATGGTPTLIAANQSGRAQFTKKDTSRIFLDLGGEIASIRWDGFDRRTIVKVPGASTVMLSPNGDQGIALSGIGPQVYQFTIPPIGREVTIGLPGAWMPSRKITTIGGDFLSWAPDGKSINYALGQSFFSVDASMDSTPHRLDIRLVVKRDRPTGTIVLRGARVLTMRGREILERGDVVVTNNRIAGVGLVGSVAIPAGAVIIDVSGKTIIPGYVDTHAHVGAPPGGTYTHISDYLVNLAYGVTTLRDPSTGGTDVLSDADRVAIGDALGPRIFSTGPALQANQGINSLADARNVISRYADFFNTRYIKQYGTGQRQARQWLIMAAKEKQITAATEPYYDIKKDVADALDGYPDMSHGWPLYPIYNDLVQVMVQSGMSQSATLITTFGGPKGYEYFFTRREFHHDPKLRRFVPHDEVDAVALSGQWHAADQFIFKQHGEGIKKMIDAGVLFSIGSHGNFQGLGYHWELEMHAMGGVPAWDILTAATIGGAKVLGLGKEIGSIEVGKLADLQVLDGDPLVDIRNSNTIVYVMKNGRLYDGNTLDEVAPRQRKLPKTWWQE